LFKTEYQKKKKIRISLIDRLFFLPQAVTATKTAAVTAAGAVQEAGAKTVDYVSDPNVLEKTQGHLLTGVQKAKEGTIHGEELNGFGCWICERFFVTWAGKVKEGTSHGTVI
jgi:hypothetical protein